MKKFYLLILIFIIPIGIEAENMTAGEAESMVTQMKSILDQYAVKIRALEAENTILREEIRKAGIKIPLSAYSGVIIQSAKDTSTASTQTGISVSTGSINTGSSTGGLTPAMIQSLQSEHGERYAKFITRINSEWSGIQSAYKLPTTAYIGGYEFVKQGADNHVFVDIINDINNATNAYDTKILYEYNTGTYQRKLIGFFELDRSTGYYKTKSGSNPFAGVQRNFIKDPKIVTSIPTTTSGTGTTTPTQATTVTKMPTLAEIEKAYSDKRYLSVISLSNTYLTENSATYDLLRIRYKTYFIIGKYTESLGEITKIESMGKMTTTVACDAQVIATYSKDSTLIAKYTTACKK